MLAALAYPKGMGMGDVKLAAYMGAGLGVHVIVALFLGFIAALVPAVVLLVRHGREARKQAIPLGPFLAFGGVVALSDVSFRVARGASVRSAMSRSSRASCSCIFVIFRWLR